MAEERFPRVWVPSPENRDLRQLLWHRHRLVQMRTRIMNQLQAVALNEGVRRKKGLWGKEGRAQLESFLLSPWATRRRQHGRWSSCVCGDVRSEQNGPIRRKRASGEGGVSGWGRCLGWRERPFCVVPSGPSPRSLYLKIYLT